MEIEVRTAVYVLAGLLLSLPSFAQDLGEAGLRDGRVRVTDHFPLPPDRDVVPALPVAPPGLPAPLEDTFQLHSNPGASKVIYLDFDGHSIIWREQVFVYDAWNREGDDKTFSDLERTIIQLAWRSIAEDFLPLDIDITTEDPGVEALKNTGKDDTEWGIRAVINHNTYSYSWAYVDSFNDAEDTELYAWSGDFPSVSTTWIWIADSVSHEAGHALGLSHDGTTNGVEYYPGHGSGDTAWSPIMGWTNNGLSQWSIGEYTNANNQQDDLSIITTRNGFGYRADDHGSTPKEATLLDVYAPAPVEGIIEKADDLDYFLVTLDQRGALSLSIQPDKLSPNLDVAATLYDADGAVLSTSSPPTTLGADFEVVLPAGRYYLAVDGTGYDDPDSDGYSDYGTLGLYTVTATAEDVLDTGSPEDSGAPVDTADPGDSGGQDVEDAAEDTAPDPAQEDAEPAGGCACDSGQPRWPGAMWLLPLVLIRRRG
jgi:hypothetical protein